LRTGKLPSFFFKGLEEESRVVEDTGEEESRVVEDTGEEEGTESDVDKEDDDTVERVRTSFFLSFCLCSSGRR
jgi:hypothetical protein